MRRKLFDIETNGLLPELTKIHCVWIQDIGPKGEPLGPARGYRSDKGPGIRAALLDLQDCDELVGHNISGFDIPAILKVYPDFKLPARIWDSLVMSKAMVLDLKDRDFRMLRKRPNAMPGNMAGRHGLEAWGHRLGKHKGDYSKIMKERGLDPWAEINDEMYDYCELDVEVNLAVVRFLYSQYVPTDAQVDLDHHMAELCEAMEKRGVAFNERDCGILYSDLCQARSVAGASLAAAFEPWWRPDGKAEPKRSMKRWIAHPFGAQVRKFKDRPSETGWYEEITADVPYTKAELVEFSPSSRQMIADRLMKVRGWKPTEFTPSGEVKVDEDNLMVLKYPEIPAIMRYLLVTKRVGMVAEGKQAWLNLVKNGRIHGRIDPNGTGTNRAAHSAPNLGQVPKVKTGKVDGVKQVLKGEAGGWGWECRSLFGGCAEFPWFVGADASGLELRMLAHFMARYDNGEYAKILLEGDIHEANRIAAGLESRDDAKTFIYAFLYGAGDALLGAIKGGGSREGAELRARFLRQVPALAYLLEAVKTAAKERGCVRSFDGRVIPTRDANSALNFLLQGGGSVVMKKAMSNYHRMLANEHGLIQGRDYNQVLWVHDEFQNETKTEPMARLIGSTMVDAIRKVTTDFNLRVPLDGEFKVGKTWAETH